MKKPSCQELGFCQALLECECHADNVRPEKSNYPFAPGVIEGPAETPKRIASVVETVFIGICLLALVVGLGLADGYFTVPGVLP